MNKHINKHIIPRNKDGQRHGYWEVYWDGTLWYKGNHINGQQDGYWEMYYSDGVIDYKRYFIEI